MFIRNQCFKKSCFAGIILKSKRATVKSSHNVLCVFILFPVYLKRREAGTFKLLFEVGRCQAESWYLPVSEMTDLGNCRIDTAVSGKSCCWQTHATLVVKTFLLVARVPAVPWIKIIL